MDNQIYKFLTDISELKTLLRFSEVDAIKFDSVAAHSYKLAVMCIACKEYMKNIDINKAVKIALFHDIPEMLTGEIDVHKIYSGKVTEEEKQKNEKIALKKITENLNENLASEIKEAYNDYNENISIEAKYVKTLDKLEALMTIIETGKEAIDVADLVGNYGNKQMKETPELKPLWDLMKFKLKKLYNERELLWKEEYNNY